MQTDEFFSCPFLVFELDNIKDHPVIFPVATLIIMDIFLQKMRRLKGVRKVICIEEAWKAIATPQMAGYVKYFFKTIRKFFGEAMVVTQEVDDVISSPIIRDAIINNADTRILLDMGKFKNKFDQISSFLGLTEFQKEQILSINKNLPSGQKTQGGVYRTWELFKGICTGSKQPEYYCYTTEQKEKEEILKKLKNETSFLKILPIHAVNHFKSNINMITKNNFQNLLKMKTTILSINNHFIPDRNNHSNQYKPKPR